MSWTFHQGDIERTDVRSLLELHFADMRTWSPPNACHVLSIDGISGPGVTFWSMREEGRLLGIGALKETAADKGEVKSMRTAPEALGRGVGSAMLAHILTEARARGYTRVSLETGSTPPFAAAQRLYLREGFVPCEPFGGYAGTPFTCFFTREL